MAARWHLRRVDLLFVIGLVVFASQAWRAYQGEVADTVIVSASIGIMVLPIVRRLDDKCDHEPPPPST